MRTRQRSHLTYSYVNTANANTATQPSHIFIHLRTPQRSHIGICWRSRKSPNSSEQWCRTVPNSSRTARQLLGNCRELCPNCSELFGLSRNLLKVWTQSCIALFRNGLPNNKQQGNVTFLAFSCISGLALIHQMSATSCFLKVPTRRQSSIGKDHAEEIRPRQISGKRTNSTEAAALGCLLLWARLWHCDTPPEQNVSHNYGFESLVIMYCSWGYVDIYIYLLGSSRTMYGRTSVWLRCHMLLIMNYTTRMNNYEELSYGHPSIFVDSDRYFLKNTARNVFFDTHHNGEYLASSSFDGTAKVWSTRDWKMLATLRGHAGKVMGVDLLRDSIVTSGFDKTLKVWRWFLSWCTGRVLRTSL